MAVEIPVIVDIEGAFRDAAKKIDRLMKPLQNSLSNNALNFRFKIDTSSTRTVKKLLDGSTTSAKELKFALSEVAARISNLQARGGFIPGNLTQRERDLLNIYTQLEMKIRGTNNVVKVFGKNMLMSMTSAEKAGKSAAKAFSQIDTEAGRANSRLGSLIKNSLRLIALHTATRFIRNVREVTAEFELQRVALGSIIQDTERAESLFKQIKAAAVESPFEIKDLVTYTKQLSAYQIETEKLFDTTMRLADISSGLGVDMGRLILAFGQVRAAAVLRGQELRQFTEAGIPLVDKLAEKFTQLNGRVVTTAEVFELISKRAVPFSMIEEIFNDMTDAGGMFYKMQQKQAETLLGQWNNLKDSVSIMYDEIGNTAVVHGAMESMIGTAKSLMQNWHQVANTVKYVGIQFGIVRAAALFLPTLTRNTQMLERAQRAEARSKQLSNMAHTSGNKVQQLSANSMRAYAYYTIKASRATTEWSRAVNSVRAFLTGNWLSIVLSILGLIAARIIAARQETQRLNKELSSIGSEGAIKAEQSVRNFERLAKTAVQAADGSREQKAAVDELVRTYGDLLPASDNVVEKLREMKGNYDSLTEAIRQKINMQIREQQIDTITSEYSKKIGKSQNNLKKYLKDRGLTTEEIAAVTSQLQKAVESGLIGVEDGIDKQAKSIEKLIYDYTGKYIKLTKSAYAYVAGGQGEQVYSGERATRLSRTFAGLIESYSGMNEAIKEVNATMEGSSGVMGKYAAEWKKTQEKIGSFEGLGETKFAQQESRIRNRIDKSIAFIQEKFNEAGIDISTAIVNGTPKFDILENLVNNIKDSSAQTSLRGIIRDFQKEYRKLEIDDDLSNAIKGKLVEISEVTGISMDRYAAHIKKAGDDSQSYMKELGEVIAQYRNEAQEMRNLWEQVPFMKSEDNVKKVNEYESMAGGLQMLFDWLSKIITISATGGNKGGGKNDVLQKVRQDISDITDAYEKYLELVQYMDKQKALGNIDILFPSLAGWEPTYANMIAKLEGMLASYKGNADATRLIEQAIANIKFDKLKTDMDGALKRLSADIKHGETARNFYNEILSATGDQDIALNLTTSIYGNPGKEFKNRVQEEMAGALSSVKDLLPPGVFDEFMGDVAIFDIDELKKRFNELPETIQPIFKRLFDEIEKDNSDFWKNFYKEFANVRDAKAKIKQLQAQMKQAVTAAESRGASTDQIADIEAKYKADIAAIRWDALRADDEWVKAFEGLEKVGPATIDSLITKAEEFKNSADFKLLTLEEQKQLVRFLEQLRDEKTFRNPYGALIGSLREYIKAQKDLNAAEKEGGKDSANYKAAQNKARAALAKMQKSVDGISDSFNSLSSIASSLGDMLDLDEYDGFSAVLDSIAESLGMVGAALTFIQSILTLMETNPIVLAITAAIAAVVTLTKVFANLKTAKANREIEKQQKVIDALERSYGRLEKAIEDAFGSDYVSIYNQQMDALLAESEAIEKQLAYAQSKPNKTKKQDKERAEQLASLQADLDAVSDKISDLTKEYDNFIAGTDVTSAARSFAESWIEAYRSFSSTTAALKDNFKEMIDNMVTSSLAAGIVQSILDPIFKDIEAYSKKGGFDEIAIKDIADKTETAVTDIDAALRALMQRLSVAGINMRATGSDLSGISKDIAGASEESILGLAAGINTQNYYMSFVPTISQNVASILTLMGGSAASGETGTALPGAASTFGDEIFRGQMSRIDENISEIRYLLKSVITPKQAATNTHAVAVK